MVIPLQGFDSSDEVTRLVQALHRVKDTGKKSLIRSTDHRVVLESNAAGSSCTGNSALVEEIEDEEDGDEKTISNKHNDSDDKEVIILTSWKTQEFAYRKTSKIGYDDDDELPTLARGLFTSSDDAKARHSIVVRGYDKFFNEGEMPWTKPKAIAAYSRPPYELSFKENGCIIFIAALSPHQLIVTSKHSIGANESQLISHAQKGEEWLNRHLRSVNKTKQDLAQYLWNQNETAVAELCDDSFEEHVLAYPPERTGLHLHGLNANTVHFQTRSMKEVKDFALQWGFLPTRYLEMSSMDEVNKFTSTVAETGRWKGIAIEGFVVRTRMPSEQDYDNVTTATTVVAPPYGKGQTWFYKVKFDEPYLMYRDWRELTRRMLADKEAHEKDPQADHTQRPELPKIRMKRPETKLYVKWCYEQIHGSPDGTRPARPELFEKMHQNSGIIRLRDMFIDYMAAEQRQIEVEKWQKTTTETESSTSSKTRKDIPFNKTLIVPVAIPGCGKTALAVALTCLFPGMGHTQSDDVQTKRTGPTFLRNIAKELDEHDVVFADRNNHLFKHRDEIVKCVTDWEKVPAVKATSKQGKKKKGEITVTSVESNNRHVRLVAMVWPIDDLPLNSVHHLCCDRVVARGSNHQSLRVEQGKEHEQVLWHFLQTRQAFNSSDDDEASEERSGGDQEFDYVIKLDIQSTMEEMVQTSVQHLSSLLQLPLPSDDDIQKAIERAGQYRVQVKKEIKGLPGPPFRYYGLSVEVDLPKALQSLLSISKEARAALDTLIEGKRVIARPHVTLVHRSELKSSSEVEVEVTKSQVEAQKKWDYYSSLCQESKTVDFTVQVDCIAWDDRAMSLGISCITSDQYADLNTLQGKNWRPHITVGTFHEDIRPYEGNRVLCEADAQSSNVTCIRFSSPLLILGRLRGLT